MKKTIYISRHSESFRKLLGEYNADEIEQIRNEKNPLSVNGERKANILSKQPCLQNIEKIYSPHYVRTMATAKYIAENNSIKLNVDSRLGERKFGVNSMSELPENFFEEQFRNWDYKLSNGECLNEVSKRFNDFIDEILNNVSENNIMIVSHGTAISTMLKRYCDVKLNEDTKLVEIYFGNKLIFDGNWNCPELFKLEFENNNLLNIENVNINYN